MYAADAGLPRCCFTAGRAIDEPLGGQGCSVLHAEAALGLDVVVGVHWKPGAEQDAHLVAGFDAEFERVTFGVLVGAPEGKPFVLLHENRFIEYVVGLFVVVGGEDVFPVLVAAGVPNVEVTTPLMGVAGQLVNHHIVREGAGFIE